MLLAPLGTLLPLNLFLGPFPLNILIAYFRYFLELSPLPPLGPWQLSGKRKVRVSVLIQLHFRLFSEFLSPWIGPFRSLNLVTSFPLITSLSMRRPPLISVDSSAGIR